MILAHNMAASNNNRQLGITNKKLSKNSEKLASGYRINYAADDAAGLAISEKMRGQIRGLNRGSLNAHDGISLVQTAEGAMVEIHSILQRMEELSVEAANDTNTQEDREDIQYEIEYLVEEIDRIAENTEFNTMKLLNGDYMDPNNPLQHVSGRARSQPSASGTQGNAALPGTGVIYVEVTHDVQTIQTQVGGATASGIITPPSADAAFKNTLQTEIVPQAVAGILNTYQSTFGYLQGSSIGIGLKLESNPGSTTLASVTMGASGTLQNIKVSYTLTINVAALNFDPNTGALLNRDDLEITVIHEMMHALMDEALTTGMLGRTDTWQSVAPFPGWFAEGTAQASAGGCYDNNDWVKHGLGIDPTTSLNDISSALAANALASGSGVAEYGTGYLATMYLGYLANGGGAVSSAGIAHGVDTILNEIKNGASLDAAIAKYTSYTDTTDFENRFASDPNAAQFIHDLVTGVGNGSGGLVAGFTVSAGFLPDAAMNNTLFELDTANDTIQNEYPSGYQVMSGGAKSDPGSPAPGGGTGGGGTGGGGTGGGGTGGPTGGGGTGGPTGGGGGTGGGGKGNPLLIQVGANSHQYIKIYIGNMSSLNLGVAGMDVSTRQGAENAIDAVQRGIEHVSRHRATLGSYQNRLEHAVDSDDNTSENLQASESYIRDANMAHEMALYSASQIIQQAGQSMLAQTTKMGEGMLQLLQ